MDGFVEQKPYGAWDSEQERAEWFAAIENEKKISTQEASEIADALELFAAIDEDENVNGERLRALAAKTRKTLA